MYTLTYTQKQEFIDILGQISLLFWSAGDFVAVVFFQLSRLTLVSASVIAEAEADEGLPTLSRGELEGIDKETVMVE